ncbi:hypothetical protein Pint_10361 [Pistacia integerrima]|uniref:Uncharacterized protein n=1 Tax=Pistacia integerrima TaxID=434235 RepID=A0ACC0XLV2_9ROSI|nr:hypothetical protein Pint_10361 [Pistacia integerrima]
MDQETHESDRIVENLSQVGRATGENSSNSVDGVVLDTVIGKNSIESSSVRRDIDEVELSKTLGEGQQRVINHEADDRRVVAENSGNSVHGVRVDTLSVSNSEESTSYSGEKGGSGSKVDELGSNDTVAEAQNTHDRQSVGSQIDQVPETVIVVNLDQTAGASRDNNELVEVKGNERTSSKALVEMLKRKNSRVEKQSCVIDIKCGGADEKGTKESGNEEKVCRICHLDSEQSLETTDATDTVDSSTMDLIHLGCGCKDELGIAHSHCAEAWFKLKGNRLCEICGQTAKNITGVGDFRFIEEWNEHRFIGGSSSSSERSGCWRGQPFCNFLMACLVIAFVLPWFFRVNMF